MSAVAERCGQRPYRASKMLSFCHTIHHCFRSSTASSCMLYLRDNAVAELIHGTSHLHRSDQMLNIVSKHTCVNEITSTCTPASPAVMVLNAVNCRMSELALQQ